MLYIQRQIEKRSIFVLILIAFLCMTTLLYAYTWAEIYSALDMFLNAQTLAETVKRQIKTLEEKEKTLEEITIPAKKSEHAAKSATLLRLHLMLTRLQNAVTAAENALSAAETATSNAEANKTFAENALETSTTKEYNAYNAWYNHRYVSCSICASGSCAEEAQLRAAWVAALAELAQDKADLAAAKAALKACKASESAARIDLSRKRHDLSVSSPYIRHEISKLETQILTLQTEIDGLEERLDEVKEALKAKRKRLAEIEAQYPTVKAYMTAFITESRMPDFNFEQYIEANPPPPIIFETE